MSREAGGKDCKNGGEGENKTSTPNHWIRVLIENRNGSWVARQSKDKHALTGTLQKQQHQVFI